MKAVLDTNVWLDWLVFAEPAVAPIARGIETGALTVLGSDEIRAEWLDVIARPTFGLDERARAAASAAWDRWVHRCARAPCCALACRDRDDQKFVDLAVAERALSIVRPDAAALLAALSTHEANL